MSNYNLKLDLSKLEGFGEMKLQGKSGNLVDCIIIPKQLNNVFSSEKGGRYLDLVCIETPNSEYGSHMVTISKTKEEQEQEKTTGERIRKPIVGNLKPFGGQQGCGETEEYSLPSQPAQQAPKTQGKMTQFTDENFNQNQDDGLPF